MKRWITINPIEGSQTYDYDIPKKEFPDYIVDKSHFIPTAEILRNLEINGSAMHNADLQGYDFKDGKDTGMMIPPTRRGNGADLAEVEQFARDADISARNKVKEAIANKKLQDSVNRMKEVSMPPVQQNTVQS